AGNPAIVARPVSWSAAFIDHHVGVLNAVFAAIQVLLGLGIAWRPTRRLALAASVAWALAVWWLGEGLGGLLSRTARPRHGHRRPRRRPPLPPAPRPSLARRGCPRRPRSR